MIGARQREDVLTEMRRDQHGGGANHLLNGLPAGEMAQLRPHLEHVGLAQGQVLQERGLPISDLFLPTKGLVSLLADTGNGRAEVGMIGAEGLVGVEAFLSRDPVAGQTALVHVGGLACRIPAKTLAGMLPLLPVLRARCFCFIQSLLVQVGQSAACNSHHSVAERCARWMLMAHDRMAGDTIPLTHEFLATMLGVRRAGVTVTSRALQDVGAIRSARGRFTVTDRERLEAASCGCYRIMRESLDRVLTAECL